MKNNKFLLFVLLPLIYPSIVCIYLFSSFPAYSKQNNTPEPRLANSKCDQKYPESIYPEAKAYCDGLAETKKTEPEEIWRNLTAIVEHNKKLIWEDGNINSRVLVLTWTSWNGYEKNLGKSMSLERDAWVTAVPDLREFCTQYSNTKNINNKVTLPYRINQLLGLTPEKPEKNQRRKLVEIWVEPKYLFRPTPDPEITDREAELDFSRSNLFVSVSNKYKYWFFHQWMTNNYPWTRLGYTYDWGNNSHWETIDPNRPNNVGLSEFIIRKGSSIKVHSVSKAENYCQSDLNVIGIRD
ncbi:MAG: hypothetical protein QNJ49_12120 [Mastigocoleus sp. MO_167.B18]|nr:hypothetical protein [Mastigocoleus sp. MO_167.B18]